MPVGEQRERRVAAGALGDRRVDVDVAEAVVIVTLVPAFSDVLICVLRMFAVVPVGVKMFGLPPSNVPLLVAEVLTLTLVGSSSHSPALPSGADASTRPTACKLFLLEVSTRPPLPASAPPREAMEPAKFVYSSDHSTTVPPSPCCVALASMRAV
jgi:hypothetical protein